MKTIAFAKVRGCVVYVEGGHQPSDVEWDEYIALLRTLLGSGEMTRVLVHTRSGWPSANQRRKLFETAKGFTASARVAVLTSSAVTRTAVNALNWLIPVYRMFALGDVDGAAAFLGLAPDEAAEVKATLDALQAELR